MKSSGRDTIVSLVLAAAVLIPGCKRTKPTPGAQEVVVYTSVDQVVAAEVFSRFEAKTGIEVKAVYDTEAGKTTGLFRRLVAEKDRPRADVFWNGEICRTLQLVEKGLAGDLSAEVPADWPKPWVDPKGRWVALSLRARVIVYNTKLLKPADVPKSLSDLVQPRWRGRVAMANPLFGTTATHMAALYAAMGDDKAKAWLAAMKKNGVRIVEGNSVVRDVVARGEVSVGLTDTDDVYTGIANGLPIDFILPDQQGMGTLLIPNSAIAIEGGPNARNARHFIAFLLRPEVEEFLARGRGRQLPVRESVPRPRDLERLASVRPMAVDYEAVAARIPGIARDAEDILNR